MSRHARPDRVYSCCSEMFGHESPIQRIETTKPILYGPQKAFANLVEISHTNSSNPPEKKREEWKIMIRNQRAFRRKSRSLSNNSAPNLNKIASKDIELSGVKSGQRVSLIVAINPINRRLTTWYTQVAAAAAAETVDTSASRRMTFKAKKGDGTRVREIESPQRRRPKYTTKKGGKKRRKKEWERCTTRLY